MTVNERLLTNTFLTGHELTFLLRIGLAFVAGFVVGAERESRGKPAGISTHCFVICGAALFSMLSMVLGQGDPARVAAQIVTGVGFLGAGIILKSESGSVHNLTTAASIWFGAGIGMSFGFGFYAIGLIATVLSVVLPRIPHISARNQDR